MKLASTPDDWQTRAACKGLDPNMFVIERGVPAGPAKKVCQSCFVREPCLDYAKGTQSYGVWGGQVLNPSRTKQVSMDPIEDGRPVAVSAPTRSRGRN